MRAAAMREGGKWGRERRFKKHHCDLQILLLGLRNLSKQTESFDVIIFFVALFDDNTALRLDLVIRMSDAWHTIGTQ